MSGPSPSSQKRKHPMDVFHKPRPVAFIMAISRFMIHHVAFAGIPVLSKIPGFHRLVGWIRACQIHEFDFPKEDLKALQNSINKESTGFLSPNHPEMMTDLMVDWAVGSRVSSRMAFWAARQFVNGPLRPFWIRHNLIANTKCRGPHDYSLESAVRGDGVMLHPEGGVWWTSDRIQPLFPGIASLSLRAARTLRDTQDASAQKRAVYIAPVVWKYRFDSDVSAGLHREMNFIEKRLSLRSTTGLTIAERFAAIQWNVLLRNEQAAGVPSPSEDGLSFFQRQEQYFIALLEKLEEEYNLTSPLPVPTHKSSAEESQLLLYRNRIFRIQKATDSLKSSRPDEFAKANAATNELMRVLGFSARDYNRESLTQEHVAESLKRLRQDLLQGSPFDFFRKWMPLPVGPRVVHVRACERVRVDLHIEAAETDKQAWIQDTLQRVRTSMQTRLDLLNQEHNEAFAKYAHRNLLFVPSLTDGSQK
jgi:hypothetical protein